MKWDERNGLLLGDASAILCVLKRQAFRDKKTCYKCPSQSRAKRRCKVLVNMTTWTKYTSQEDHLPQGPGVRLSPQPRTQLEAKPRVFPYK